MSRKFDRYMVVVGMGRHIKLAHMSDSERCAHVFGVLSIAAQAPVRGCLLVGDLEATAATVASEARVSHRVATSALAKLKAVGVLERDAELACWRVHDWDEVNPADPSNAARQAKWRARNAARNAEVTPKITAPSRAGSRALGPPEGGVNEVEEEERLTAEADASASSLSLTTQNDAPVDSPLGAAVSRTDAPSKDQKTRGTPIREKSVTYQGAKVPAPIVEQAEALLAEFNIQTGHTLSAHKRAGGPSEHLRQVIGALLDNPDAGHALWLAGVRRAAETPPGWAEGRRLVLGDVFGPKAATHTLATGPVVAERNGRESHPLSAAFMAAVEEADRRAIAQQEAERA